MNNSSLFEYRSKNNRIMPLIDDASQLSVSRLLLLVGGATVLEVSNVLIGNVETGSSLILSSLITIFQTVGVLALFALLFNYVGHTRLRSLFHKITARDAGFGVLMLILNTIYSQVMNSIIPGVSNAVITTKSSLGSTSSAMKLVMYIFGEIMDLFMLLSEELVSIIPFLALAALFYKHFNLSRNLSIWLSLMLTIIIFGLIHFSSYDWHLAQMILVIGMSRLFFTGAYIRTKNILIPYIAHFTFDAVIAAVAMFLM